MTGQGVRTLMNEKISCVWYRKRGETTMKLVGGWLFRHRSYTPISLYVMMVCVFWKEIEVDSLIWPAGLLLVVSGETLRLWAIRHIGKSARTRKAKAERLVTSGPYALTRNPLYLGNMMICLLYTSPSPRDGLLSRMPSSA